MTIGGMPNLARLTKVAITTTPSSLKTFNQFSENLLILCLKSHNWIYMF
jgi:hypothetical protein